MAIVEFELQPPLKAQNLTMMEKAKRCRVTSISEGHWSVIDIGGSGTRHIVSNAYGEFECDCEGWVYRRAAPMPGTCKHVTAVRASLEFGCPDARLAPANPPRPDTAPERPHDGHVSGPVAIVDPAALAGEVAALRAEVAALRATVEGWLIGQRAGID
jgi:hypothetical protein